MSSTTEITAAALATAISEALNNHPVKESALVDFGDHIQTKVNFEGTLKHGQIVELSKIGEIEIKRSGAGLSIQITTIK